MDAEDVLLWFRKASVIFNQSLYCFCFAYIYSSPEQHTYIYIYIYIRVTVCAELLRLMLPDISCLKYIYVRTCVFISEPPLYSYIYTFIGMEEKRFLDCNHMIYYYPTCMVRKLCAHRAIIRKYTAEYVHNTLA